MAKISIFGLGYVGSVMAACLADNQHHVIGVDVNPLKVEMIQEGVSPIVEPGLDALLKQNVVSGRLRATTDVRAAVRESEISFVCVGTPSNPNGSLDLSYVKRVCEQIGGVLADESAYHTIVLRSTTLPGTTEQVVIPLLERSSGKRVGFDFAVAFNPEFLREGTSLRDFAEPPFTLIGAEDNDTAERIGELYRDLPAPILVAPIPVAEMVKYVNNAFHALKVTFANEVGNLCKQQGIDSHQVMNIVCQDRKLNLSPYYLSPGFAFGGSCLPKDLRAMLYHSRSLEVDTPLLDSILLSNRQQIDVAYQMIKRTGSKYVGVLGLSFKAGTDDLRESPMVELVEHLIGKGYHVRIYDRNVSIAHLNGANRAFIEKEIPHLAVLMTDALDEILDQSRVIVVGNRAPEFRTVYARLRDDQVLIDLVRIADHIPSNGHYQGICW